VTIRIARLALLATVGLVTGAPATAEPWIAVRSGFKCVQCHVNPTGGGLRTVFGSLYAQTELAARRLNPDDADAWTGSISRFLSVGGNARANAELTDMRAGTDTAFDLEELRLFLDAAVIPDRLSIYFDQRLAPGSAVNLEANVRLWLREGSIYVKAGQFYLPYGLRLEDDSAFVRQVPGLNMTTPDNGVELGFESRAWSAQLALANGSAGAAENDDAKLVAASAAFVQGAWRIGASASRNGVDAGERLAAGVFAGLRTGQIAWLGEADWVDDDSLGTQGRTMLAGLLEANWLLSKGHNVKLTAEYFEPDEDVDEDEQNRLSVVWEYFAIQFLQMRVGARLYDGVPQSDPQNRREYFVQLHGYF
jgi:hypothetical protein